MLLNACSGGLKPDPLHSLDKKKILKRSHSILPKWVTEQKDVWEQKDTLILKVYHEGETILSNARAAALSKIPELARLTLRDYVRDRWLLIPDTGIITNVRINTALYLSEVFNTNMDSMLSNTLENSTNYWEFWEKETREDTRRGFTVYLRLLCKKMRIESIIMKQAKAVTLKTGRQTQLTNLASWLKKGLFSTPAPRILTAAATNTNSGR